MQTVPEFCFDSKNGRTHDEYEFTVYFLSNTLTESRIYGQIIDDDLHAYEFKNNLLAASL